MAARDEAGWRVGVLFSRRRVSCITETAHVLGTTHAIEEIGRAGGLLRFPYPFNPTGPPAFARPCGFDRRGLPLSLQIAARPLAEDRLRAFAHRYEQAHEWWRRGPDFARGP